MSKFLPIVTAIVPTTTDRLEFNNRIEKIFYGQDYPNKQLLFSYENDSVGTKRNELCQKAMGEIICHLDSDDIYTSDWITKSADALMDSEADVAGLSEHLYYDIRDRSWHVYTYPQNAKDWVAGATMVYWKEFWRKSPFPDVSIGEDNQFLRGTKIKPVILDHGYGDGFVATVHNGNTCKKSLYNPRYRRCSVEEEIYLFERWKHFVTNPNP